jgi:hypothetical protein
LQILNDYRHHLDLLMREFERSCLNGFQQEWVRPQQS